MLLKELSKKIIEGYQINKEEAMDLILSDLEELVNLANVIRMHFNANHFDICTIINGKSGRCSEDCKFCSQSSHFTTISGEYSLLRDELIEQAKYNAEKGILRYSVVTSGKALCKKDLESLVQSYKKISSEVNIKLCASHGLLEYEDFIKLKEAGVCRYHNNLETSKRFFPNICTTHSYDDKIRAIKDAQRAGLTVCSGGIIGLGENFEDRIDMAFALRELGIRSIPINILNPIPGTPFEKNEKLSEEEIQRVVAIYRFIHPDAAIRLAGGRGLLKDKGRKLFSGGANAAISGDMLTTSGICIQEDLNMLKELGYIAKYLI